VTLRPKQESVVQILDFLDFENGGKMLHRNVGCYKPFYFLDPENIGSKSFQYLINVYQSIWRHIIDDLNFKLALV
jgi:hypothetical protein